MRIRTFRALLVAAGSLLPAGCGGGGGGGGSGSGGPTLPAFRVAVLSPSDGAQQVPTTSHVVVVFTRPVDPSSVAADAVRVGVVESGEVAGTAALRADGTGTAIEFVPNAALAGGKNHTVFVSSALRSSAGDALGGTTTFSFATAGGSGGPPVLPPATALRPTAHELNVGRRNHTATVLKDGRVLLCGGYAQGTVITDRAEVFDPLTESFALLPGRMRQPRAGHTATRLADGRVMLAGGWYEVSPGTLNISLTAEVFDPATGEFTNLGNLGTPRADHAALRMPDGRVLLTGGSQLAGAQMLDHDTAEAFDPASGTFSAWPHRMSHTRSTHGMVDLMDGRWLLVGGSDVDLRPETFEPLTGLFTPFAAPDADQARFGAAVARFTDGDVAVVGGEATGDVLHFRRDLTLLINSGSGTSRPRAYATATVIGADRILVAGGIDFANGSFVLASCDLVVEGGPGGSQTYATQVRFPTGMADHTATLLGDGRVLFAGGLNPAGGQPELTGAYLFTP